jgi:hypothetical protein
MSDILSSGLKNIDWSKYEYIKKDLTLSELGINIHSTNE